MLLTSRGSRIKGYNNSVTHRSQLLDTQVLDGYNNPSTHRSLVKSSTHRSQTNKSSTHRSWVRVYHRSCEQTICVELWANKEYSRDPLWFNREYASSFNESLVLQLVEAPKYSSSRKCHFRIITIWEYSYSLQVESVFLERALYCNR